MNFAKTGRCDAFWSNFSRFGPATTETENGRDEDDEDSFLEQSACFS